MPAQVGKAPVLLLQSYPESENSSRPATDDLNLVYIVDGLKALAAKHLYLIMKNLDLF